ncbi:MAG: tRNA 2-thiouridine(34) synthase MnmA [Planctomycetes bacterium]|nr:tRNA 2-thiouridine(34) synthase MnmA [Planctomycetota bacterium]
MNISEFDLKLYEPSFEAFCSGKPAESQVAVMMSGGVDSSVAAYLLQQEGFDVVGVTMRIPVACGVSSRGCCGADAAYVCGQLKMPHYFVDVTEAFNVLVIDAFRKAYSQGRTPNPCVDCNSILKFSLLWDFVSEKLGVANFATGHYAQVLRTEKGARLCRAVNKAKDQSYFIYGVPAEKVEHLYLPLGGLTKSQVREIAAGIELGVAEKAESMELCFAGEGDYRDALGLDAADREGDMLDMQGNKIGTHKGVANYTLGQRRGLGFAAGEPVYVGRIDPKNNIVALGTRDEVTEKKVSAEDANVLVGDELFVGAKLFGKIRSGGDPYACVVTDVSENGFGVEFDEPVFAPCPGQRIVLYNELDHVIAGGVIV